MANQTAANLSTINTIYYAATNPTQVHNFYKRRVLAAYGADRLTDWLQYNTTRQTRPATTFYHVENDRLQQPITVGTAAGAAGAATNVTLTSTNSYLNSGTYSSIQAGYKLFDGTNYYTVNSVNTGVPFAFVINITPDVSTVAVSFTSGQTLDFVPIVAVVEGSSASANSIRGQGVIFSNTMQEWRRDIVFTGQALASFDQDVTFWDFQNPLTLEPDPVWSHAEADRVYLEFLNGLEVYDITGQGVTTAAVQTSNGLGTTGVIPGIKAWGNTLNYSKVAGIQINDYESMSVTMEKNQSAEEWEEWVGVELFNDTQNVIKDFFPNGAVVYDSFNGGKAEAASFGFQSIAMYGRTWHMHNMQVFNRPDWLAAPMNSGDYIGSAIILPRGSVIGSGKYGEVTQPVNYIEMVSLEGNGVNYGYDHWIVDGTGTMLKGLFRPTTTRQITFCWATTSGIELNAAKQLFYMQRTN